MKDHMKLAKVLFSALFIVMLAPLAQAQQAGQWVPSKSVRIVVPSVGGSMDQIARIVAPELQKALGQPVIVDNKGGAGGSIGAGEVARLPADGHTLLVGFNGPISINPMLMKDVTYDPIKDFVPITLAVTSPQLLVVNSSVPVSNVKELIALAKAQNMAYASIGHGSNSHLTMEMFKQAAKVEMTHVAYKGAGPAVTDLLGGQVAAAFFIPGIISEHVKSGKVKVLATSGSKRFKSMPQIPTMIEQGFPTVEAVSWIGFLAKSGTPQDAVQRYNKEIVATLSNPSVKQRLEEIELEVIADAPAHFSEFIKGDIAKYSKVIKSGSIKE